jgi:hypothetical protein
MNSTTPPPLAAELIWTMRRPGGGDVFDDTIVRRDILQTLTTDPVHLIANLRLG